MRRFFAIVAALLFCSGADAAVTRFKCNVGEGRNALALEFTYDDVTRKAQVVGNAGAPHCHTKPSKKTSA
jgi:hypothetical protein